MSVDRDLIQRAKTVLPLPDLWRKLAWPGEPKKACRVPYRPDDARESGSVFQRGTGAWCFHDFKSSESFDEIDLLALMEGLDKGEAIRRFLALVGIASEPTGRRDKPAPPPPPRTTAPRQQTDARPTHKPAIGPLREPTPAECEAIASSRGLHPDAAKLAACDGLLFVGERLGFPSWVLTDSARWNAQYRRLDGAPYALADGRQVKTLGVKAGWAAWPLGWPLLASGGMKLAVLVEGTPDALAAYQVISEAGQQGCAVVCMAGAGLRIPAECLPAFHGRRVRIFCDADSSGRAAALRWEQQLQEAGATVDAFDLSGLIQADGKRVKDLNDACRMAAGERAQLGLMEGME